MNIWTPSYYCFVKTIFRLIYTLTLPSYFIQSLEKFDIPYSYILLFDNWNPETTNSGAPISKFFKKYKEMSVISDLESRFQAFPCLCDVSLCLCHFEKHWQLFCSTEYLHFMNLRNPMVCNIIDHSLYEFKRATWLSTKCHRARGNCLFYFNSFFFRIFCLWKYLLISFIHGNYNLPWLKCKYMPMIW